MTEKLVIISSGPAGLTAAVYAARADLDPLLVEGLGAGGQLMLTTDVENYPGFPDGIMGPELMGQFRKQAERFGTRIITSDVSSVDFSHRPFSIRVDAEEYRAEAVIISTVASAPWLGTQVSRATVGRLNSWLTDGICRSSRDRQTQVVICSSSETLSGLRVTEPEITVGVSPHRFFNRSTLAGTARAS